MGTLSWFFVRKEVKLAHEKRNPEKGVKNNIKSETRKSKVWLSPPREKGGVTAKKTYMGVGSAAREKGRRDEGWNEISA